MKRMALPLFLSILLMSQVISGMVYANEIENEVADVNIRIEVPAVPFVGIPVTQSSPVAKETGNESSTDRKMAPELYSFEFDNVPLYIALRAIAKKSGSNIVLHSDVEGTISLSLSDVTLSEVLDVIAQTQGLSYVKEGNIYIFGPARSFVGSNRMVQRSYSLKNATVDSMRPILDILTGSDAVYVVDDMSRTVIVRGPEVVVDRVIDAIQGLDKEQRQVMLMISIIQISRDQMQKLGANLATPPTSDANGVTVSLLDGIIDILATPLNVLGTTFELQARLDALGTAQKANLLATPSLATLNGRRASIFLGDQVPIVSSSVTDEGTVVVSSPEWVEVGIRMNYVPWINSDDQVTLDIEANIQAIESYVQNVPQINSRDVQTTIRAKNGQPIVIGGLFRKNEIEQIRKLAILGDLPVLGPLFRNSTKTFEESEIVIVLVPHILD